MMDVLGRLEAGGSVGIGALAEATGIPRSTVYRILNTLEDHRVVRRGSPTGPYRLGPRLLALAGKVDADGGPAALAAVARPHLERLAAETGECGKLSVVDGGAALVVEAVPSGRDYAIGVRVGRRLPLHAGAAGKVLLAHLPEPAREAVLLAPLPAFTELTAVDRPALEAELAAVRAQGWAVDRGEHSLSVRAVAAPVRDHAGRAVAAVSVPYLATADAARGGLLRDRVIAAGRAISRELGCGPPAAPGPAPEGGHGHPDGGGAPLSPPAAAGRARRAARRPGS